MSSEEDHHQTPSEYAVHLLQSLFKSATYSDVTIRILPQDDLSEDGKRYRTLSLPITYFYSTSPSFFPSWKVHKCVLATASKYFEIMFSGNFRESNENEIFLKDVPDIATFDMVLAGVYGHKLRLDESNVLAVLRISNLLQFTRIETECWDFILSRMDDFDNSHEVLALSDQLGQMRVYNQALSRVAYNFRQLRTTEEFQEQDVKLLYKLISSDDLRVNSEKDVVDSVLHWIDYDRKNRIKHLGQLVQAIRGPLLTKEVRKSLFNCRS